MAGQQNIVDHVDKIAINNTEETVTYNGTTYQGEQASNAAFLIRIAIQKFLGVKDKCESRESAYQGMIGELKEPEPDQEDGQRETLSVSKGVDEYE